MATLNIALASPRVASSVDDGLERVRRLMAAASGRGALLVCFPEAYLPGLRGQDFDVPAFETADQQRALDSVSGGRALWESASSSAWSAS